MIAMLRPRFALLLLATSGAAVADLPRPAAEYFGDFQACALVQTRDRHRETWFEFGPDQCHLPQSPCSTFKIPNALIGLQQGVVSGPDHVKEWDGETRQREETNRDHDLASAIRDSVVWYFQSLARDVGAAAMQQWLKRLDYGNQDISGGIDRFWLSSSLQIDAYRQLEIIKSLDHQTLPFKPLFQQQVSDMLIQSSELPGLLHGKTGSCRGAGPGQPDHGWFVGWIDWHASTPRNPVTSWFVVNIRGSEAWGWHARPIALSLLQDLKSQE
ncbi:MAG: class D beta-lactamase [Xanthomonadales bacterium]|nr:class D beta-lactamase [Xanthomonadales bacterium]